MIASLALPLPAANSRLYLTDGTYHVVREYEVKTDRIRYYSVERSAWEEIPLDLIDLKRTRAEEAERTAEQQAVAAAEDAENQAERAAAREVANVPYNPGVYWVNSQDLVPLQQAEAAVVANKRRSILKILTPIPVIAGKSTVELEGETSQFSVTAGRPEFYFRLAAEERFALVRLTPEKGSRIVEKWTTDPVSKEIYQEHEVVETFRHQVADGLYKLWPQEPLPPGEYAFIEYTEGKANTQIWDFAVRRPGEKAAPPKQAPSKPKTK